MKAFVYVFCMMLPWTFAISMEGDSETKKFDSVASPLYDSLSKCKEFQVKYEHPQEDMIVEISIHKINKANCLYKQTMPFNGLISCHFKQAQLDQIAKLRGFAMGGLLRDKSLCKTGVQVKRKLVRSKSSDNIF